MKSCGISLAPNIPQPTLSHFACISTGRTIFFGENFRLISERRKIGHRQAAPSLDMCLPKPTPDPPSTNTHTHTRDLSVKSPRNKRKKHTMSSSTPITGCVRALRVLVFSMTSGRTLRPVDHPKASSVAVVHNPCAFSKSWLEHINTIPFQEHRPRTEDDWIGHENHHRMCSQLAPLCLVF